MSALPLTANAVVGQAVSSTQQAEGLLLRFKSSTNNRIRQQILQNAGCTEARRFRLVQGLTLVNVQSGMSKKTALARLRSNSQVLYAEPNYIVSAAAIPNDPRFSELYGLDNTGQTGGTVDADIDAPEAWDSQTGADVVVAVIDT
ncbi:MAG TPA: peptidase S8, partial [Gammaproteobacteria bacterium]|nr:peptidase S8 [Gammaproteobacteria bacterium]